ncbi:hypothetical protein ACG7TL_008528 [Trametes sanguinea]
MSSPTNNIIIGHNHPQAVSESNASATPPNADALRITIPHTDARTPAPLDTPSHGHPNVIEGPATEARVATPDVATAGQLHFALPSRGSPTHPRPSARVSRRSSLFSVANDAQDEDDAHDNATVEHPLLSLVQNGLMGPTMEAEEPESAELNGRFDQPAGEHAVSSASASDPTSAAPVRDA